MKHRPRMPGGLLAALLIGFATAAQAQHGHLNAGAVGKNQGDALVFANGGIFAASSGYVKQLDFASSGVYAGFYQGGITPTALATTVANGGPVAGAPADGSFIQVRLELVDAPVGGSFQFWEGEATSPTFSLTPGSGLSQLIPLSDASLGAGSSLASDPFGHLHGRRFTADQPGLYSVKFTLLDTTVLGEAGGPIHFPSDALTITFNAVPEPGTWAMVAVGASLLWLGRGRLGRAR